MSPMRWEVLLTGFVLALPVIALGMRGDLTAEETMTRVLWCLGAGWAAVALLRWAITPRQSLPAPTTAPPTAVGDPFETATDQQPSPA